MLNTLNTAGFNTGDRVYVNPASRWDGGFYSGHWATVAWSNDVFTAITFPDAPRNNALQHTVKTAILTRGSKCTDIVVRPAYPLVRRDG